MSGALVHMDHDTFRMLWRDPAVENAFVTFSVGPDRTITGAELRPASPLADFSFDYRDLGLVRER